MHNDVTIRPFLMKKKIMAEKKYGTTEILQIEEILLYGYSQFQ